MTETEAMCATREALEKLLTISAHNECVIIPGEEIRRQLQKLIRLLEGDGTAITQLHGIGRAMLGVNEGLAYTVNEYVDILLELWSLFPTHQPSSLSY